MKNAYVLILLFLITGCQSPVHKEAPSKSQTLLNDAWNAAGTLEKWEAIKQLSYDKSFQLFREDGTIEKDIVQHHEYSLGVENKYTITWQDSSDQYKLEAIGDDIHQYKNGIKDLTQSKDQLNNTLHTSLFVIGVPFKLNDSGVKISRQGVVELGAGKMAEVIRAEYSPAENKNHTGADIWWHYFSKPDHNYEGYLVQHLDHFSLVQNVKQGKVNGITFPLHRKSFRSNKSREIKYLRAEYFYKNFQVGF